MSRTAEDLIHRHRYTVDDGYRMAEAGILAPDARVELTDGRGADLASVALPRIQLTRLDLSGLM